MIEDVNPLTEYHKNLTTDHLRKAIKQMQADLLGGEKVGRPTVGVQSYHTWLRVSNGIAKAPSASTYSKNW